MAVYTLGKSLENVPGQTWFGFPWIPQVKPLRAFSMMRKIRPTQCQSIRQSPLIFSPIRESIPCR